MSLFIKQLMKKKPECEVLKKSYEDGTVFNHIFELTMHILDNLSNEHKNLLEIVFDLMIKLQNLRVDKIAFFCKDFFKRLIDLLQNQQPQLNADVSEKLFEYVYEILNHELFNSPEYLSVVEDMLAKLVDSILNCEAHSADIFSLIHKIIEIYLKLNVR